ncbi:MAG TPA: hypothetical protein VE177_06280, partial [Candidatus Binatus sp.]|nr:hypothetical protein [Candidatus Binatus sp.]
MAKVQGEESEESWARRLYSRASKQRLFVPSLVIATSLIVHIPNLVGYPAWFFDEGAYLTASLDWLQTGHLTYYGHPFLPLSFLALLFATVSPHDYFIPRLSMAGFTVIDGFLLFHVTRLFLPNKPGRFLPLLTVLLYEATPL